LVPEAPKMNFQKAYKENPDLRKERNSSNPLIAQTIGFAEALEGSVRQTGVHACGIIISRDPLTDHIPLMQTKDDNLPTTQYDGRFVESIGLLKMDFLGLKTLSIIKETLENIKLSHGIEIDIETIPFDDKKTYELFCKGETTAIFQFESEKMKKHLRELKPNRFEDLVAMNALYRPGPMEYIPDYIARKHGRKKIEYDLPMMEKYLGDTYGITVFQEQVMLLSRLLAGFTRGDSDTLRKAMGKKQEELMNKLKEKFVTGCKANPQFVGECELTYKKPAEVIEKIWRDWEAFASYAFNKSHSVCYAYVAYHTGYLKAHFPAEFMAANLSRNLNNSAEITKFMTECKRMRLNVMGPDINESFVKFTVNKNGDIRFGLAAIKGVGEGAVEEIIKVRNEKGDFKDIYDFVERVSLQSVNKKTFEGLATAGAFDGFEKLNRHQFFVGDQENDPITFVEKLIRYGNKIQQEAQSMQQSLFGDFASAQVVKKPEAPNVEEWPKLILLEKERNLVGVYLTAHPLDDYKLEMEYFCSKEYSLKDLSERIEHLKNQNITFGGMVTEAFEGTAKNGLRYSKLTLADYQYSYQFVLFGQDYVDFSKYCKPGLFILMKGRVQKGYSGELRFDITHIELLSEARKNLVKSVTLTIPFDQINESVIEEMEKIFKRHKGNTLLKFNIYDAESGSNIKLFSRNIKIDPDNELFEFMEDNPWIVFHIN
ncbi:MAG: DNA polymerase III subunit alpha, partial [Prolixibacteraceae bacterium]|nr:DNA polymerase III subunit alpha [Prolixibacteraceae bacterium]